METKKLTAESTPIFQEGIGLILSRWSALTAAVENEWGGRDSRAKANMICSDVISFFTDSKKAEPLYIDDLENILEEGLLSLNTLVEDGSIEEVAEKLMIIHEECLEGNYQSVEKLRTTHPPPVAHVRPFTDEDEDELDDDEDYSMGGDNATNMMVDVPNPQSSLNPVSMPIDEPRPNQAAEANDGWVVVSSRKNKGRRN